MAGYWGVALAATLIACGGGGPEVEPIDDQVTAVGEELVVEIRAASSGQLGYAFSAGHDLGDRAQLRTRPDGSAVWAFRPDATDVGTFAVDFEVVDASGTAIETINVDVRSALGNATLPVFRRPAGSGTVLDGDRQCIDIPLELTDQDSTEVRLSMGEPVIEGAELLQENEFSGVWHWCPTPAQRAGRDRFLLTIMADDRDNPPVVKRFQIILRDGGKPACAGAPPEISHSVEEHVTVNDIAIVADVLDDAGLKGAPLLYYSTKPPDDPIDLSTMTQLTMEGTDIVSRGGTFRVEVPNPLIGAPSGSSQTLYYAVVAEDNDDVAGDCDHVVLQRFETTVSTPGGDGQLGLCEPCSADDQCGGADDHCLPVGLEGDRFCFQDCAAGCPDGYVCSNDELESVEGQRARQCVPIDERCASEAADCPSDAAEPNDGPAAAQPLAGQLDGRICPLDDVSSEEDWFALDVASDAEVTVALDGVGELDIDLAIFDEAGFLVASSLGATGVESITECLPAGRYHARVYSYFSGSAEYTLRTTTTAASCGEPWWGTCEDDGDEDDDDEFAARAAEVEVAYASSGNQICAGDDDWYEVYLYAGETLYGTLDFALRGASGDLDVRIYDDAGDPITQCWETDPSGCSANGQAAGSGESFYYDATYTGAHYVVVHGWGGGENAYDICLSVDADACPSSIEI